jgi:AcrR family transcriptional regulator
MAATAGKSAKGATARASTAAKRAAPVAKERARNAYRAGILEVAEQVLLRSGFHATKMTDVARAAGVAVGTLYNYFESKERIFEEILTARCMEMRASLEQALQGGSPREKVAILVRTTLDNLERNGALFAMMLERGGVAEYDIERLVGQLAQQEYQRYLALFEQILEAGVEAGELRRDIAVSTMVAVLSGAMNGAAYAWLQRKRRGNLSALADDLLELFFSGVGVKP